MKTIILLLITAVFLLPAQGVSATEDAGYFIQDYHVEVVVNTDRSFDVTETIDVWFHESSHGIYREIPTYSAVESYRIADLRAVGDPFVKESEGVIRIGDPDVEIKGHKTYTIEYRLEHWADTVPDADYFYMDIIGTKWNTTIENFSARIKLPESAAVEEYTLTGGAEGSKDGGHLADVVIQGDIILVEGLAPLPAGHGITLNVKMPEGTFYDAVVWEPALEIESLNIMVLIDEYGVVSIGENYTVRVNRGTTFYRGLYDFDGYYRAPSYKVSSMSVTGPDGHTGSGIDNVDLYGYAGERVSFSIDYVLKNRIREGRGHEGLFLNFMNWSNESRIDYMEIVIDAPFDVAALVYDGWTGEGVLDKPVIDGTRLTVRNIEPFYNQRMDYVIEFDGAAFIRKFTVLDFALPVGLGLGALCMLYFAFVRRKEKMLVPTVEFHPPDGMSPAVVGYIIDEHVSGRDVTSLIYFWASHGHLNIEITGKKSFRLHLLSELDEQHPAYEHDMFSAMWALGTDGAVTDEDLKEKFYTSVNKTASEVRKYFSGDKAFYKKGRGSMATKFGTLMVPVLIVMLFVAAEYWLFIDDIALLIGLTFVVCLAVLILSASYRKGRYASGKKGIPKVIACIALSVFGVLMFAGTLGEGIPVLTVSAFVSGAAIYIITFAAPFLVRRSDFGVDVLGKCIGFKTFLKTAEKGRIEMLLEENPNYYYDILPFAQVLKVTKIWQKKFDGLLTSPPTWCYGTGADWDHTSFDTRSMSRIMDSMEDNMVSSPSSSGGGSFSSGGSSGGGSGGGGGGRW